MQTVSISVAKIDGVPIDQAAPLLRQLQGGSNLSATTGPQVTARQSQLAEAPNTARNGDTQPANVIQRRKRGPNKRSSAQPNATQQ